ncbi:hypothetical protein OHC33_005122 [Knufia fluminis]|uniref:Uncharacterized protein n=2 Tax=Knufia TaxID=430999 RepID=A0AAN8I4A7_9EURO|nr:hypothetical protein OHC33_005122 [Knufia fluminis]
MPPPSKPAEPFLPSTEQTSRDASEVEAKKAERETQDPKENSKSAQIKQTDQAKEAEHEEDEEEDPDTEPTKVEIADIGVEAKPAEAETEAPKDEAQTQSQPQAKETKDSSPAQDTTPLGNKELDMVLSIPSPSEIKGGENSQSSSHPHLEASPYEHHFDTYTLVQELCKSQPPPPTAPGVDPQHPDPVTPFSEAQAITLMKAIRLMLAANLDLAKDGLVSKSDTENETYLFRAACSELKTTMQTSRFMEAQKQRSQRAQLQHESDILNQKVSQDIMTMREELKGMFNDRKLTLQEEKRQVDGKIQSLSYRISVDLNSEAKSEVEGLRWVLTRRAALAIIAAAFMVLSFLQYYSVKSREQAEVEKRRSAAQKAAEERMKKEAERFGGSGVGLGRSMGTQTDGIVLGGTAGAGNYEESLG